MALPSLLLKYGFILLVACSLSTQLHSKVTSPISYNRLMPWQKRNLITSTRMKRNAKDTTNQPAATGNKQIVIGLLIPYNVTGAADLSRYSGGEYYASAFLLAIEDINKNKNLLPGITLDYVWNDTMCLDRVAIKSQIWQHRSYQGKERKGVDAFIGTGCKCASVVKNAAALNLPIISHVCIGL